MPFIPHHLYGLQDVIRVISLTSVCKKVFSWMLVLNALFFLPSILCRGHSIVIHIIVPLVGIRKHEKKGEERRGEERLCFCHVSGDASVTLFTCPFFLRLSALTTSEFSQLSFNPSYCCMNVYSSKSRSFELSYTLS